MYLFRCAVVVAVQVLFTYVANAQDKPGAIPVQQPRPQIFFDVRVPELTRPLPAIEAKPAQLPTAVIRQLAKGILPSQRFELTAPEPFTKDDLSIRVSELGAVETYPSFAKLGEDNEELDPRFVLDKVRKNLVDSFLPQDKKGLAATTLEYGRTVRRALSTSEQHHGQRKLMYVTARRRVGPIPVDGPGSRIVVAFDAHAAVSGVFFNWSTLVSEQQLALNPASASEVQSRIREQISGYQPAANVHVKSIDIVYYDWGGGEPLKPAYRFVAEVLRNKNTLFTTEHLVGYVPLLKEQQLPPSATGHVEDTSTPPIDIDVAQGKVLIGRFVAREDSLGWKKAAEDFLAAALVPGRIPFVDLGQTIAARPEMFGVDRDKYINRVDVALVEAHGVPLGFTTKRDGEDAVYIEEDIQKPGLGAGGGGRLKHWILHSCRAVPAPDDFPPDVSFEPLWNQVFKGVGSVVGYRTPMFIADGVETVFATSLLAGAPVVPAWFNAVSSLSIYGLDASLSFQCENLAALGRASAVVACGSADAKADTGGAPDPKCLEMWWVENEQLDLRAVGATKP